MAKLNTSDTICALATPPGISAIAVLRVSGKDTFKVASKVFTTRKKDFDIKKEDTHTLHYGSIARGEDLIDDSLKSLETEFPDRFVRIHRSVLVAVRSIARVERDAEGRSLVVLRADSQDGGKALIISRRHVADVRRRLQGGH